MSVKTVLYQRQAAKIVEHVNVLAARQGMSREDLFVRVYGPNFRSNGFSNALYHGRKLPANRTLARWAPLLDVPVEDLIAARGKIPYGSRKPDAPRAFYPSKPATPLAVSHADAPDEVLDPSEAPSEALVFTLDSSGRASIRLSLTGVPMDVAMRFMAALGGMGLFNPPNDQEPPPCPPRISMEP